jgi:hypothetical protein
MRGCTSLVSGSNYPNPSLDNAIAFINQGVNKGVREPPYAEVSLLHPVEKYWAIAIFSKSILQSIEDLVKMQTFLVLSDRNFF